MLAQTSLKHVAFNANSRYYGLDTATIAVERARSYVYVKRRFVPPPEKFQLLQEHTVEQGERLDNIAAQYLGDPTLFWRLCDAKSRHAVPRSSPRPSDGSSASPCPTGITGSVPMNRAST